MLRSAALTAFILAHLAFVAASALADQTDSRLDDLFSKLHGTSDRAEGRRITRQIRIIWRQTENDVANNAMANAGLKLYYKRYDEALDLIDRAIAAAPDYAEAWSRRAAVLYLLGDFSGAVEDIRRTLALEPRHFGALSGLGLIYLHGEQWGDALKAFRKALEINPHLPGARSNIEFIERQSREETI